MSNIIHDLFFESIQRRKLLRYKYFDTPDGQDTFKKLWSVVRPTIIAVAPFNAFDVIIRTKPKGFLATIRQVAVVQAAAIGIVSTFVLVTNSAASIREKDDRLNWFIGGAATGSIFGFAKRSPLTGFNMAMVFGVAAVLRKEAEIRNYAIFVKTKSRANVGGATSCLRDWSLIAERPRNWTTGQE